MSSSASNGNQENEDNKNYDSSLNATPASDLGVGSSVAFNHSRDGSNSENPDSETSGSHNDLVLDITLTEEDLELLREVCFATSERVSQSSDLGVEPSVAFNHSSGACSSEYQESESRKIRRDEAALEAVTYNYIFRKQLTWTDVIKGFYVPKAEAAKHVPSLQVQGPPQAVQLQVYDFNRKQTMTWRFKNDKRGCSIRGGSSKYIDDNNLQKGDSVLFYLRKSNQKINNTTLPPYAVQIEKSTETIGEGVLCIPLDDLENAGTE